MGNNYTEEFKKRVKDLFENSVIFSIMGTKKEEFVDIESIDRSLLFEILTNRMLYIQHFLSSEYIIKLFEENKSDYVYKLAKESLEVQNLLEEFQRSITLTVNK